MNSQQQNKKFKSSEDIKNILYSILFKSIIIFHTNEKGKEPYFIYDQIKYMENEEISYEDLKKMIRIYEDNKGERSDDNITQFVKKLNEIEDRIKKEFNYKYYLKIKIEFTKEEMETYDELFNITALLTFYNPIIKPFRFRINDFLENGANSEGFEFLLNDINDQNLENLEYAPFDESSYKSEESTKSQSIFISENLYSLLKFEQYYPNYKTNIQELEKKGFINQKKHRLDLNVESSNAGLIYNAAINPSDNNFLMEAAPFIEPPDDVIKDLEFLTKFKGAYIRVFRINENLVGFTSNSLLSKGKDGLFLYDIKSKEVLPYESYSFLLSQVNTYLIKIPESFIKDFEKNKIYLFACKKYCENQKNGILLSNITLEKNKFYPTENFEVYCFCQISEKKGDKILSNQKDYTEFCLIGGYNSYKKKGLIKLYQFIFKENNIEIQFEEDIIIDDEKQKFKEFKAPITYINQSSIDGKVLAISLNKEAYLFEAPNKNHLNKIKMNK